MLRALVAIAATALALAPAHAETEGHSLVGFGFGPAAMVHGALAREVHGDGPAARVRLGGRFGRLGAELVVTAANLARVDGGRDVMVLTGPSLTWYALALPRLQLGARGGLVAGSLAGDHDGLVPCARHEPCETRPGTVRVSRGGFALDVGVTAQLALGPRRGNRAVLWIDLGAELTRFQWDDRVVTGRTTQLVLGIAHGIGF